MANFLAVNTTRIENFSGLIINPLYCQTFSDSNENEALFVKYEFSLLLPNKFINLEPQCVILFRIIVLINL